MGPSSILFGSVYRCVCTFEPGNFTGCGSDPVVHVRVRLTMETPKLPACTKSVRDFRMLKLDTIRKKKMKIFARFLYDLGPAYVFASFPL